MTNAGGLSAATVIATCLVVSCATPARLFIADDQFYDAGGGAAAGVGTGGSAPDSGGAAGDGGASGGTAGDGGAGGAAGASIDAGGGSAGAAGTSTDAGGGSAGTAGATTDAGGGNAGAAGAPIDGGGAGGSGGGGPCSPDPCNGHGFCSVVAGAASCDCDEGFDPPGCAVKNALYGQRVQVVQNLADPDVIDLGGGTYLLSGTGPTAHAFDFYESTDLTTWSQTTTYDPSAVDSGHDYCDCWSPEIVESGGKLSLYFSAYRGPEGATTCPPPSGSEHTVFRADSVDGTPDFGVPQLLFQGQGGAQSRTQSGCPAGGCGLAMRIDPAVYDGRIYYVFFDKGSSIGSVSMADPTAFLLHTGPAGWTLPSYEENINESPEVFAHDGRYYLFFSGAWYNSQYATFYVTATSEAALTRALPVHRLTTPVRRNDGMLAETHGSNSIATRLGEAFNFFGLGVFNSGGQLIRRDTYRQRLVWNGDGTLMSQNQVQLSWNSLGAGYNYSIDLVLRDGSVIGPCIAVGHIGQNTSTTFTGICPDAADRLVHKSQVQSFRLYASQNTVFVQVGETPYDGFSDMVNIVAFAP